MPNNSTNWRQHVESTSTQVVQCESVLPVDTESNRNPLVFNIRASPGLVVDTKNIKLAFTVTVKKQVGSEWVDLDEDNDKVALYNNFGFSAFEDVQLFINGTLCETSLREYPRSSFLQNQLFTPEHEQHALESAMFLKDNPMWGDTIHNSSTRNPGEWLRGLLIKTGKTVSLLSPVYSDILQADCFMPDNTGLTLRFYPTKTDKCVMQKPSKVVKGGVETHENLQLKLIISKAELHVPRCRLTTPIPKTISGSYECSRVFNYVSQSGMKTFSTSLNTQLLPKKMAMIFLSETRYEGTKGKSGLVFNHHKVSNITVKSNGRVLPTLSGMNMDPENKNWTEGYDSIFSQLHAINPNINLTNFDNGNAIYGINLQRGTLDERKLQKGTCDIDITFQEAPSTNVVILLFCYYDSKYTIDKNGFFASEINPKL